MGPGPHKAEDVLKVMEALTGAVLKDRVKIRSVLLDSTKEQKEWVKQFMLGTP